MRILASVLSAAALLLSSCSDDSVTVVVRNLDGPTDIAFACIGDLNITSSDTIVQSAQPLASCVAHSAGEVPPGQEGVVPPSVFGFVLQATRGTVAIVDTLGATIADADPFAPGRNAIPIGTLPVGLVSDQSGCYAVSANAGSCDLSVLDVASAVSLADKATVTRIPITNASGQPVLAKPRSIERGQLPSEEIGVECPANASGRLWVAFPGCNLVAAIDASTGEVTAGVKLQDGGGATIVDGNVECPNQCGTGAASGDADAGVPEPPDASIAAPVEVQLSPDGNTVYIGSQNSPELIIVDLDEEGALIGIRSVVLEGDVGITAIEVTETVSMGGAFDSVGQVGVDFTFAYVIATDGSIRVVDVVTGVECDTQVDPRYLRDITNIEFLACMPVGDVATPPRRAGARGPGIRLPSDAIPLDLAIATLDGGGGEQADPLLMSGTFLFLTATDGNVFIVNVDDDNYSDFEVPADPSKVWMTLAVPHQLRDFLSDRNFVQTNTCGGVSDEAFELPPRLVGGVEIGFGVAPAVSPDKGRQLPRLRHVECQVEDSGTIVEERSVGELSLASPVDVRERAFPDLLSVSNEDWFVTWEGSLSLDGINVAIDGRPVRSGVMANDQGLVTVTEAGAPFCALGVEPYDFLQIIGCDPARGDEQCGIGESCYVHPQTPSNVTTGMCVPTAQIDSLAGPCRDVLVTRRRYTIKEAYAAQVILGERARVLRTSPLAGCESDAQCQSLASDEDDLGADAHPVELEGTEEVGGAASFTWSCQADPTRRPGPDRCVMVCEGNGDCEDGTVCSGGVCVEGKLPPEQCTQAIQRYQVRAGEAFAVVGTRTGYLHNRVADPDTTECIADPEASPTQIGRIPLDLAECAGDGFTDLSPNPCLTTVTTFDEITPFEERTNACVAGAQTNIEREVEAVRFSNPIFTVHLIDLSTTGDAVCNGDGAGDREPYSPRFQDYSISFTLTGGFIPLFVTANTYLAELPVRIRRGPSGLFWVMDQGDDRDPRQLTRGRVLTVNPANAVDGFSAAVPYL